MHFRRHRGGGACKLTPTASSGAADSGLSTLEILAVTPDGKSVYVPSEDNAVVQFKRKRSGSLKFDGCLAADTAVGPAGSGACDLIPGSTAGATGTGLQNPVGLAISPDSKSLYAVAESSDSVVRFKRKR